MPLRAGDRAPDFSALTSEGAATSLGDYRGRWVVLVFLRWLG
jgi:peroxiredoxin